MNEGGGTLSAEYNSIAGTWSYSVYYDRTESTGNAFMEIQIGENKSVHTNLNISTGFVNVDDIVMNDGDVVKFKIRATEGVKIKRIEIRCKK